MAAETADLLIHDARLLATVDDDGHEPRAYAPMTAAPIFDWLRSLYPRWTAAIDEEAEYLAAWVGLAAARRVQPQRDST